MLLARIIFILTQQQFKMENFNLDVLKLLGKHTMMRIWLTSL